MLPSVLGKIAAVAVALMLFLAIKKQLSAPARPANVYADGTIESVLAGLENPGGAPHRVSSEERFQSIASGNPENVARVMKNWMAE